MIGGAGLAMMIWRLAQNRTGTYGPAPCREAASITFQGVPAFPASAEFYRLTDLTWQAWLLRSPGNGWVLL